VKKFLKPSHIFLFEGGPECPQVIAYITSGLSRGEPAGSPLTSLREVIIRGDE